MELSLLCGVKIVMCLYDNQDKFILYNSDKTVPDFMLDLLSNRTMNEELYTDKDVWLP